MQLLKREDDTLYYAEALVSFFGVKIQTRMFVARLDGDRLWVCSPLILTAPLQAELNALGTVEHILSPNKIHNQGLASFHAAYPDAKLWASPGLAERKPELPFAGTLGDHPERAWAGELDQLTTRGNTFFSEVTFFHRKSRSLIVADLVENLNKATIPSRLGQIAAKATHIYNQPLPSPEFRMYTEDAEAALTSLQAMADWPFDKILLAHGSFIETNAKATFQAVIDQLYAEASSRPPHRKAMYRYLASKQ